MTDLDHLSLLAGFQDEFLTTIPKVDPTARVLACPAWQVRHLVVHLARVHHWAAGRARRKAETPLGRGPFDLAGLYAGCAAELRATLGELDPTARAATLVGPGPVAFWHRRQVHETLVHLWDLRTAGGLDADAAPGVWADGVDEVVTMLWPRQVARGRSEPLGRGVGLVSSDTDGSWVLGAQQPVDPVSAAAVTVTGPARSLDLLLWRRVAPDEAGLTITGDRAALDAALAVRLTP